MSHSLRFHTWVVYGFLRFVTGYHLKHSFGANSVPKLELGNEEKGKAISLYWRLPCFLLPSYVYPLAMTAILIIKAPTSPLTGKSIYCFSALKPSLCSNSLFKLLNF